MFSGALQFSAERSGQGPYPRQREVGLPPGGGVRGASPRGVQASLAFLTRSPPLQTNATHALHGSPSARVSAVSGPSHPNMRIKHS